MKQTITKGNNLNELITRKLGVAGAAKTSGKLSTASQHAIMSRLVSSPRGRARMAALMQEPLRTYRDYQAVGRRAFYQDDLPDGAIPAYDTDPETPAYVVSNQGDSIVTIVNSSRIIVPLFEIVSLTQIKTVEIKERRFDVVKRVKQKAKDEMFRREDKSLFAIIRKAGLASTENPVMNIAPVDFDMGDMADAFAEVAKHGLIADKIFMNPLRYPVFMKAGRDYLDFESQRSLLQTGYLGVLYGAQVFQSPEVVRTDIYVLTEPEYFGVMPVRIDMSVAPADNAETRVIGWSIQSYLGAAVTNANGIQALVIA